MKEQRQSTAFRFGLGALFVFVTVSAVLLAVWRQQLPSRSEWQRIKPGTNGEEVFRLIGSPDRTEQLKGWSINTYELPDSQWLTITIGNGRVIEMGIDDRRKAD